MSLRQLLSAPWLLAQQPPVFRATSTHVMVDVVVTDKDGRAVKGLTEKDLIIRAAVSSAATGTQGWLHIPIATSK